MSRLFWIYTDASADIAASVVSAPHVGVVPMDCQVEGAKTITVGGPQDEGSRDAVYAELAKQRKMATSQVGPLRYIETFAPHLEAGEDVLYLSLSSGLSSTVDSARMAQRELAEKYPQAELVVIDSLTVTAGLGLLVDTALQCRNAGCSLQETVEKIQQIAPHIRHWYVVDDLNHLYRNGRLSRTSALLGTALQIKPVLHVSPDGKLGVYEKKRGRKAADRALMEHYFEDRDTADKRLFVLYSSEKEKAENYAQQILAKDPEIQIELCRLSPIIAIHTGPGCLVLIYVGATPR